MAGGVVFRTRAATVQTDPKVTGRVIVRTASPASILVTSVGRQGPIGPEGKEGPPGPPGDGVADPGDLTLWFQNALV